MIERPPQGHSRPLATVLRPSCARSLLGKVADTTPTRGRETTVGPSENPLIIIIVGCALVRLGAKKRRYVCAFVGVPMDKKISDRTKIDYSKVQFGSPDFETGIQ